MKKYLFLLILSILTYPGAASAAIGDNCATDLTASINDNIDWSQVYIIRGADGSAWQRAIMSRTDDILQLNEGQPTQIQGTGQPFSPVQLFIFAADTTESGGIKKPDAQGTCFDAGTTDAQGLFTFPVSPRLMWGSIGKDVVIDAFTRLEESWDQLKGTQTNQNYFIGTHIPTKRLQVQVNSVEQSCPRLCTQSPYTIGTRIRPDVYPEVARTTFPFADTRNLNAGGLEPRTGNEATSSNEITIAKLAPHTYYTMAERDQPQLAEFLDGLAQKALLIETIKRYLVGSIDITGVDPTLNQAQSFSSGFKGMSEINEDTLTSALIGQDVAPNVQQLVQGIHDALTAPTNSATRNSGIDTIAAAFNEMMPDNKAGYSFPTRAMMEEVLPAGRPEEAWKTDFVDILKLWTEDTKVNTCLMPQTNIANNFMTPPNTLNAMPIPEPNCAEATQGTQEVVRTRAMAWSNTRVHGEDPVLVLKAAVKRLEPNFSSVGITKINVPFTSGEGWDVTGTDFAIEYEYSPFAAFTPKTVATACIAQNDIDSYAEYLTSIFGLPENATGLIALEIDQNAPDTDGFMSVQLADPAAIGQRIDWKTDGKNIDVAQLFFRIKEGGCSQVAFELPSADVITAVHTNAAVGYEIGILK